MNLLLPTKHTSGNNNHWPYLLFLIVAFLFFSSFVNGQTYPGGFSQSLVVNGISSPTALAFAPASDGRIFVTQQGGALRVIKNGSLLATAAVQLTVNSDGERGLIGLALDPDFTNNQYIYLYYTATTPSVHNRIVRYTMDGDEVSPGSNVTVLDLDGLSSATNHNGGAMAFGPDGKLYVGVGENANGANAQDLDTYHGKLLRINSDGSVPAGNPYLTGTAQKQRVWAYGLRNPYTFEFQPGTGKLFLNDVGETTWEEINDATSSGLNFGWPSSEGATTNPSYTTPVYAYGHGDGDGVGCAVTGGTFFNPAASSYPAEYTGKYFFMDFCQKWINYIDPTVSNPTRSAFATGLPGAPLSLTTGPDGNLYYLSRTNGALYKIVYGTTSVQASQFNTVFSVYPQPAGDVVHIDLKKELSDYSIQVVDRMGTIFPVSATIEGNKLSVQISALPAGIYALRVQTSEGRMHKELSVLR